MLSCVHRPVLLYALKFGFSTVSYVPGVDSASCIKKGKDGEPPID